MKLFIIEHVSSQGATRTVVIADNDKEAIALSEAHPGASEFNGSGSVSLSVELEKGRVVTLWGVGGIT